MRHRESKTGFTLLELIVVITIIGIMGSFVVSRVSGAMGKARITQAKNDIHRIYDAALLCAEATGHRPDSIAELVGMQDPDTETPLPGSLVSMPKEPWGNEYVMEYSPNLVVFTLGRDGAAGGEGEDADFYFPSPESLD